MGHLAVHIPDEEVFKGKYSMDECTLWNVHFPYPSICVNCMLSELSRNDILTYEINLQQN